MAQIYYYDHQSAGINVQSPQSESTPRRLTLAMTNNVDKWSIMDKIQSTQLKSAPLIMNGSAFDVLPVSQNETPSRIRKRKHLIKLNYCKQVFFPHPFICMRNFITKTKTTQYSTFKTDIIKVGLVFLISNFFY